MTPLRERSIRQKLIVMGLIASSAALILACGALLTYEFFAYRDNMVRVLSIRSDIIGTNSVSAILFKDEQSAAETLASLKDDPHIISAGIYIQDNYPFARYGTDDDQRDVALIGRFANQDTHRFESDSLILVRRIVFKGEPIGTVLIRSDLQEMYARMWQYIGIILIIFLVSSLVALVVSAIVQRKITQPLLQLVDTARTVTAKKDYSIRARTESNDEMGILVVAFNEMLTQIERQSGALQRSSDECEQRVIERTRELQYANEELETFSYSVSHDLQSPLRGIDGFCQALVEDNSEMLDERGKDHLKRIQAAIVRMGQLVDDLLDFSKVNRMQLRKTDIDLSVLAQGLLKELQFRDPTREVEFHVQTGLVVKADEHLIAIVLTNLLENAWKFTSKHKHALIEVGVLKLPTETAYFVRDNGAGFDMAYVNKLFAPFQRLHTQKEYSGTGIGLATVQRIVSRHGGRVWAEGEMEKGASLYFSLPTKAVDQQQLEVN
jgi:signal transduction histidine kinase